MDRAIRDGKTGYCPAAGIAPLREALADDVGRARLCILAEKVVVQPGGKPVITKFLHAVMNPGDEVLYPNPGYPIYESQIEYLGGVAKPYRFVPGEGTSARPRPDPAAITPRTALIYNDLQNPIGARVHPAELEALAELAIEHDLWVLSDEAYFEMPVLRRARSIASLPGMQERTVILYTFSKKFAMTGLAPRRGDWSGRGHHRHRQAEHQRRDLHHPLRPVGRRRGLRGDQSDATTSSTSWRDDVTRPATCSRDPGRELLPAEGHLLPVP